MPPDLLIAALIGSLLILVGASILWSTLKTGISPMPSSPKARRLMLEMASSRSPQLIYELGSGFGTLAIPLAKQFPHAHVISYELSPVPWFISKLRVTLSGVDNITLRRQDFLTEDLKKAELIICYLYPGAMSALSEKFRREPSEATLISNTFALRDHTPVTTHKVDDMYRSPIYLYELQLPQNSP